MKIEGVKKASSKRVELAIHKCQGFTLYGGKVIKTIDEREVEVLARSKGYAMVRRKGCAPYVAREKELFPVP